MIVLDANILVRAVLGRLAIILELHSVLTLFPSRERIENEISYMPLIDFFRHWIPMNRKLAVQQFQINFDDFIYQLLHIPNLVKNGLE